MPNENSTLSATALDSALRVIPADIVHVDGLSINGLTLHRQLRIAFAKAAAYDRDRELVSHLQAEVDRLGTALEQTLDAMDPSQLHPEGDTEAEQRSRAFNIVYEALGLHEQPHEPEMSWAEYNALYGDEHE